MCVKQTNVSKIFSGQFYYPSHFLTIKTFTDHDKFKYNSAVKSSLTQPAKQRLDKTQPFENCNEIQQAE